MLNAGLFAGQRFELIDGDLIDKMGQNPPHANAIRRCKALLEKIFAFELVDVQMPIEAGPADQDRSEPEPDVAVLAEKKPDFDHRHPNGQELALLVEVADTTSAMTPSESATSTPAPAFPSTGSSISMAAA
jgi:hypothetical protein